MSNYHIMETAIKNNSSRVVFHIAVPNETNAAGENLQTAIKEYQDFGAEKPVTSIPWLQTENPTEYTQIENGEIYEYASNIYYDANLSDVDKRDLVDTKYNRVVVPVQNRIRNILRFWGLNRDVP